MKKFIWALALIASGCVIVTPPIVIPPTPPPTAFTVACVVTDGANPIVGAICDTAGQQQITNSDGYASFQVSAAGTMHAHKDGYDDARLTYPTGNSDVFLTLVAQHVDPSVFSLNQLAAIRGAMWPQTLGACGNLSLGPRPGQDDNIIGTVFITDYPEAEQDCIISELKRRGYTHVVMGPLVDSDGYHGMWPPNDWRGDNFSRFLDAAQKFWDAGLIPVVFIKPDNWPLEQAKDELTSLLLQPRARKLLRVVVPMGWEAGAAYEYSSCTWAAAGQWVRDTLNDPLALIHMVSDRDAPAGTDAWCNDDDHVWNPGGNAAAWGRVAPFYHGWLVQSGAFDCPDCLAENGKSNFQNFQDQFNPSVHGSLADRFVNGYAGWPRNSAWAEGPIRVFAGEYKAYWTFWGHRSEAEGVTWGDAAMASGALGYLDSGSVPVPVK